MIPADFFILLKQELFIVLMIFLLLFYKLGKDRPNRSLLLWVNVLLLINLVVGFLDHTQGSLFSEMYHTDRWIVLQKNILNLAMLLISLQAYDWLEKHQHAAEFYILLLSSLLGLFFMISSGHLLMFYLGLEMSTIPLAAAANFDLLKKQSSEAAMKLIISSAFSSALLLLGISFVYGTTGTLSFAELPSHLSTSPLELFAFVFSSPVLHLKYPLFPFTFGPRMYIQDLLPA